MTNDAYLTRFDPFRDPETGWVTESASAYARRMQNSVLTNWPEEVLIEWLHRHAGHIDRYAFIGFERLSFVRQTWPVDGFPSQAQFKEKSGFGDTIESVRQRARGESGVPGHYPAQYLLDHGTWNTPVVMFDNAEHRLVHPDGWSLMTPFHLLEGHSRLSYFLALRAEGLAQPRQEVWVASM